MYLFYPNINVFTNQKYLTNEINFKINNLIMYNDHNAQLRNILLHNLTKHS